MDGDGEAELITKRVDRKGYSTVYILKSSIGDYQSNFRTEWLETEPLFFGDYDSDQI